MTTYKEQQENKKSYVLVKDCKVIATFGNLKKISDYMDEQDFPSYWTLIRKKDFPIVYRDYRIFKVKHF